MAFEIIDLTTPPPSPVLVKAVSETTVATSEVLETGEKKRKRPRRGHGDATEQQGRWQHDKYSDSDAHDQNRKRNMHENGDRSRRHKRLDRFPRPFFMVDTAPSVIAGGSSPAVDVMDAIPQRVEELAPVHDNLLLPAHVMLATEQVGSLQDDEHPLSPVSVASGIDFADDDRVVGTPRYFDDRTTSSKAREPCKKCGDSGHDSKHCTIVICLTCGARDEHSSRSCPILRFCWNCKAKGHLARDCPRIGDMDPRQLHRGDCERCGSQRHHGTNCPTLWRTYTYLTETERDAVLANREAKRHLGLRNGGEGYIARDPWCYNCGNAGHLGDDCEIACANHDKPSDFSAFGSYNQLTGPFASSSTTLKLRRAPREWEADSRFDDGYGFSAQANVGRKGRENAKAKAREAQRLLEEANDEPDWFSMNQTASKGNGRASPSSKLKNIDSLPSKPAPHTIEHGFQTLSSSQALQVPKSAPHVRLSASSRRPSLRDRIDMDEWRPRNSRDSVSGGNTRARESRRIAEQRRGVEGQRPSGRKRPDDRQRDRETDDYRSPEKRNQGSRWRGGYDR